MNDPEWGSRRWLARPVPDQAEALLFGFPCSGMGASTYAGWPQRIGQLEVLGLQPPGRESRYRERSHRTHEGYAADLAAALRPHLARPYALAAHCGGVPYALETLHRLATEGLPPPCYALLSSWGAPQRGLYGRLNYVDLQTFDAVAEVSGIAAALGWSLPADVAEIVSEALREDLEIQRGYRYAAVRPLPCPVVLVGWTADDVVPAGDVEPGWHECGNVQYSLLEGDHREFMRCPPALRRLITQACAAGRAHGWTCAPTPTS